jgi:hypothetical protein
MKRKAAAIFAIAEATLGRYQKSRRSDRAIGQILSGPRVAENYVIRIPQLK